MTQFVNAAEVFQRLTAELTRRAAESPAMQWRSAPAATARNGRCILPAPNTPSTCLAAVLRFWQPLMTSWAAPSFVPLKVRSGISQMTPLQPPLPGRVSPS